MWAKVACVMAKIPSGALLPPTPTSLQALAMYGYASLAALGTDLDLDHDVAHVWSTITDFRAVFCFDFFNHYLMVFFCCFALLFFCCFALLFFCYPAETMMFSFSISWAFTFTSFHTCLVMLIIFLNGYITFE